MNAKVKEFIDIYQKVDKEFLNLENDICHKEAEKYFGKYYCELTISKCSEEEFTKWWNKNKEILYNNYYYELACYIWNVE